MDPQLLLAALEHTYNPLPEQRRNAEAHLKLVEVQPGYAVALLQIIATQEVALSIRQAAAITFKNLTKNSWRPYESKDAPPQFDMLESDRDQVKQHILDTLVAAPALLKAQLSAAITAISRHDFPDKWDNFIPKILELLSSSDPIKMHGALLGLYMSVHRFQFTPSESRGRDPLYKVIEKIFPPLLIVFKALSGNESPESGNIQYLICKIFSLCTYASIPPFMMQGTVLEEWMQVLLQLVVRPIPAGQPSLEDDRPEWCWWKAKKWSGRIFERFIRRYGQVRKADTKTNKKFGKVLLERYAVTIMEGQMNVVSIKRGGNGYLPDKVFQSSLCFLRMCMRYGKTYVVLKPHMDTLLKEIIFPSLCLTKQDFTLWNDDPQEYLRKEFDAMQEYYNPRTEAINYITDMVQFRGRSTLHPFMNFVVSLLNAYNAAPAESKNYREKDGCLNAIGALGPWLKGAPEYMSNLEMMLTTHVFPEFRCPVGFLRARACWIFSQFFNLEYKEPQNYTAAIHAVLALMGDSDMPVRVQAGLSLKFVLLADKARDVVRPLLPQALEAIFKLMSEIDNDDLVATLEHIIDKYEEEMEPFALALTGRLSETFIRLSAVAVNQTEDDDDDEISAAAALECLIAIRSLLRGLRNKPNIYRQLEVILIPLITQSITPDHIEYLDELLKILTFMTFYSAEITPQMWSPFPKIYEAFDQWARDYVAEMVPPIDNYISKAPTVFVSGPFLEMTFNIYRRVVGDANSDELAAGEAVNIMESILHNCTGMVDKILPEMLDVAIIRLTTSCQDKEFKIMLIELIANSLFYNAEITIQHLESKGYTGAVFGIWLATIPKFKRQYDIKLIVMGLSAIFNVKYTALPAMIQQGAPQIMGALVSLLTKSEKIREDQELNKLDKEAGVNKEATANEDGDFKGFEDDDDDDEYAAVEMHEIPDDQDVDAVDSDDDMDMMMLGANVRDFLEGKAGMTGIEEDDELNEDFEVDNSDGDVEVDRPAGQEESSDEDTEDFEDDDDDEEYTTPIDKVDEMVYFAGRMKQLHERDGPVFQGLVAHLPPADQQKVQLYISTIAAAREEALRVKLAAAAAASSAK